MSQLSITCPEILDCLEIDVRCRKNSRNYSELTMGINGRRETTSISQVTKPPPLRCTRWFCPILSVRVLVGELSSIDQEKMIPHSSDRHSNHEHTEPPSRCARNQKDCCHAGYQCHFGGQKYVVDIYEHCAVVIPRTISGSCIVRPSFGIGEHTGSPCCNPRHS